MGLFKIFRDHLGFGNRVPIGLEYRNSADREFLAEFWHAPIRRLFESDVGNALGVDLHPHPCSIGAEVDGIEFHHSQVLLCAIQGRYWAPAQTSASSLYSP